MPSPLRPAMPGTSVARRAVHADREAFGRLVGEFDGMLRAIARGHRLSHADAADVAQTAWMRLWQNRDRLESPDRAGAWLATTARRESLRKLRVGAREIPAEQPPERPAGELAAVDRGLLRAERDAALWDAFGRLPRRDQELLRMLLTDPRPAYEEIAATLDMPIGSIGPTRRRALERLRRELERSRAPVGVAA